jgi:hypothetical protein
LWIETSDGRQVEMPVDQVLTLGAIAQEHPGSTWHFNDCGCCVCLHTPDGSWVIGPDGESEYFAGVGHG